MHFGFAFLGALILLPGATSDTQQNHPAEIPSQFKAIGFNLNFASAKTITVAATSRRPENPDTPEDLDHLRKKVLNTLRKIPITVAADGTSPDLSLELIVEPNVRYGMFHSQNAPYIYLLVREHSHGPLVYCAYQRASHFFSASERLLGDLERTAHQGGTPSSGSLAACAEQAMRPL